MGLTERLTQIAVVRGLETIWYVETESILIERSVSVSRDFLNPLKY